MKNLEPSEISKNMRKYIFVFLIQVEASEYPDGLVYFDTNHNCAVILGLNYFGELKKATLTLAQGNCC